MTRNPRLPRHRMAPGQIALWNRPVFTVLLPHGRSLTLLHGGRAERAPEPEPVVGLASGRKAA